MNFAFNSKAEEENSIFAKLNAENKLNSRNNLKNSFRESHRAVAFSEYSPVSSSQSLLQNFSPGTPETDFNGTSLEIDNFQNINNIYNISSAEKRSKYSVKTHFDRPEEEVESGLENDFSEGAGLDNRNFKRPFDTKLTRPSTLPITSCLELQVDMMDCKEVTPDNLNEFLEEGFQLISCQDRICDLYVKLHEPGSEELLATFGSIILSFINDIKEVVNEKMRLGLMYERERNEHGSKVKRMEDEIEEQMKIMESKIRIEENKKLEKLNKEWKTRHFEEVNSLHLEIERLKTNAFRSQSNKETTSRLQKELDDSTQRNENLQKSLDDCMAKYSALEKELGLVKSKLVEKESELARHKKLSKEDSIEIDNLISQIEVLQTSNKTLHEKTEDLCEALRICRSYYKTQMKQKSALTKDDFIQKYLDESCISLNRTFSREHHLSEIKSNKTYSSGFGEDEDLDSSGVEEMENLTSPSDFFPPNSQNTPSISNNNNHPLFNSMNHTTCNRLHSNNSVFETQSSAEPERIFKIVLAGDVAVGKSSLIMRLCKNKFVSALSSTVGVDFQTKTLKVDGKVIALQIWDTAGQERFRSIAKSYFRRADGVLLLYDITYEKSFLSVRDWLESINEAAEKSIPIMLIGNKSDLRVGENKNKCVKTENGMDLAREENCLFVETSAKSGQHINEAVVELSRGLMAKEDLEVQTAGLKLDDEEPKKKTCCG